MRLGLKYISQETKDLLADVLAGRTSGFLNGVDLSTPEGKRAYIEAIAAGKNPFRKQEEGEVSEENTTLNIIAPWADIVREANRNFTGTTEADLKSTVSPFKDILLNTAYRKKLEEIQMETALPEDEIAERLLEEYSNYKPAQKSLSSAVKFFHDMSSDIFSECESCGHDNEPMWIICEKCGKSRDGSSLKKDKKTTN